MEYRGKKRIFANGKDVITIDDEKVRLMAGDILASLRGTGCRDSGRKKRRRLVFWEVYTCNVKLCGRKSL